MSSMVEQIAELQRQLEELRLASAAPSISGLAPAAVAAAPSAVSALLQPRPISEEVDALVAAPASLRGGSGDGGAVTGSRKAPAQPEFHGHDYRTFLTRYKRWSVLSGVDAADDATKRMWFLAAMGEEVLSLAEALDHRTSSFEDLVRGLESIFPTYANDFTIRSQVQSLPGLSSEPRMEEVERLLVGLEQLWARMSVGAFSDQEKVLTLSQKMNANLWKMYREHPTWKNYIDTYETFKCGLRGLVNELQNNMELDRIRGTPVFAVETYRGKPDKSTGMSFRSTISCHFCGRKGHCMSECWK
jgi:hypothetical protein